MITSEVFTWESRWGGINYWLQKYQWELFGFQGAKSFATKLPNVPTGNIGLTFLSRSLPWGHSFEAKIIIFVFIEPKSKTKHDQNISRNTLRQAYFRWDKKWWFQVWLSCLWVISQGQREGVRAQLAPFCPWKGVTFHTQDGSYIQTIVRSPLTFPQDSQIALYCTKIEAA